MLETYVLGTETDAPPLLIAHGLFGSGRNWRAIARRLSKSRQVVTVDMRNHGCSFWSDSQTYADMADDLAQVVLSLGSRVDLLGHSMGGKAAMVLALAQPELLRSLIVADISPIGYGHTHLPNIRAMQALPLDEIMSRKEAESQLAERIEAPEVRAFLLQSLVLSEEGNRWSINLDALAANMDHVIGFPDVSGSFAGPTLFLRGANSDYVGPDYRPRIKELFPTARIVSIKDAGHWLHAEKPREVAIAVDKYLQSIDAFAD